ncbi:MAG: hypothetical protein OXB84_07095 [Halobacteriovoraceae bacterium]|nr:hypothetical protein [Halobacteriovoraceae bacterium]
MNRLLISLTLLIFFTSCGYFNFLSSDSSKNIPSLSDYQIYEDKDYIDQLVSLAEAYKKSPSIKIIKLGDKSRKFLQDIYKKIMENNEFLLLAKFPDIPNFYIINNDTPFYFSLPRSNFFFSSGLIKKHLKSEELFVAVLVHEIIKSRRNLYLKKIIVPVGYMSTSRMLALTRVPLEIREQINKWSFHVMRRAGYDPSAYLIWLQIQNKNTIEFTLQLSGGRNISQEEYLFKSYIIQEKVGGIEGLQKTVINPSKYFYSLIKDVKKVRH